MSDNSKNKTALSGERLATRHRRDIQGLRALAVVLVALDHAGVGFLKGGYVGVDVFFVLSGYLITGVLVSSAEGAHAGSFFSTFYAHRARRILPAAVLTLVVTDIAASHLLNLERAHETLVASISATFFVANFHFASIGTNYFAMGRPPSPIQHYWSLSVEEQFYLVWPFLVAAALIVPNRLRSYWDGHVSQRSRRSLGILALGLTGASLAYGTYYTHHSAAAAYFSTPSRAWELGLGALLSLNAARVARLPPICHAVLGWVGLLAIASASTLYSASTSFPGLAALLPAIGAAAVIAAGIAVSQSPVAPSRLLSLRPARFIGDRSYTFYLWHWPILILAMEHVGHSLSLVTNLLLLVAAFILSVITYAFFENPIRRTPRLQTSLSLALWPTAIALVLFVSSINWSAYADAVNLAVTARVPESLKESETTKAPVVMGASSVAFSPTSPTALVAAVAAVNKAERIPKRLTPSPLALETARYHVPASCIADPGQTTSNICSLGDTSGAKSLVVFGDSHAQMWIPAIASFAQHEGYVLRPLMKVSCTPLTWAGAGRLSECAGWYKWAVAKTRSLHPSLLILATHYEVASTSTQSDEAVGNISTLGATIKSSAKHIVVLGDPPGQTQEPADCLLARGATMRSCSASASAIKNDTSVAVEATAKEFGGFLDSTPWFCYELTCPMVVGHTVVYADQDHITDAYAEELAPLFRGALKHVVAALGSTSHSRP